MPKKPTNRPAKAAKRRKRLEKRRRMPLRQKPARQKPAPKRKFAKFRKKLATAALIGASCLGVAGCAGITSRVDSMAPLARREAQRGIVKSSAGAVGSFVPVVGGKVGEFVGEKAADLVLGPDFLKELEKIPKDKRFKYMQGLPMVNRPWFEILGLTYTNPEHRPMIDVVEMVNRQSKVLPEEIVLVLGAYPKPMWEDKVFLLRKAIPETGKQITMLEQDLARIVPKFGKKEDILKKLKELYKTKDRMAIEFMALKTVMNLGSDPRINSLVAVINKRMPIEGCRKALDVLY